MFFAGVNFVLYFRLIRGDFSIYKNPELRFYILVIAISTLLVTANLYTQAGGEFLTVLRQAAFQVVSIITTTGFATADFDAWHHFSRSLLLLAMFIGACGGSTGGSIKQVRWMLMLKHALREVKRIIHPRAVASIKIGDYPVNEEILRTVMSFGFLYLLLSGISTLFLTALGLDFDTAISAVAASLGNVGPGLAMVGPTQTYQVVPPLGKFLLSVLMIIGRLEIYTVLVVFLPESRRLWSNIFRSPNH